MTLLELIKSLVACITRIRGKLTCEDWEAVKKERAKLLSLVEFSQSFLKVYEVNSLTKFFRKKRLEYLISMGNRLLEYSSAKLASKIRKV